MFWHCDVRHLCLFVVGLSARTRRRMSHDQDLDKDTGPRLTCLQYQPSSSKLKVRLFSETELGAVSLAYRYTKYR
jgi:hypothetical protein